MRGKQLLRLMVRKLIVIANRNNVYDITKWIHSHPGGQEVCLTRLIV
jgi:cytochrome b involved in lipid metabolism